MEICTSWIVEQRYGKRLIASAAKSDSIQTVPHRRQLSYSRRRTYLDVFAHALWTSASALTLRPKLKPKLSLFWAAVWGVSPDLATFTAPAAVKIWRLLTGQAKSLLPDGRGPRFDWVWDLYNFTHSALVFAVIFGGLWLILRRPVLEMLGWALHIVIDVFTHTGLFATHFLWPLSAVHVDGPRWEEGWALAANYTALAAVYVLLWMRNRNRTRAHPN